MRPTWALGVDVGGTWLRACLWDPRRRKARRLRLRREPGLPLAGFLRQILRRWGSPRLDGATVGLRALTPGDRRRVKALLSPWTRRVRVVTDLELAWLSAFRGRPGVVVVCGTGSGGFGRDGSGRRRTCGGLGPLFGDEGSAFWIGKLWLKSLEGRVRRIARRPDVVRATASLARQVARRAASDPRARRLLRLAAGEMALLAERAARGLRFPGAVPVSWSGGMFRSAPFLSDFLSRLRRSPLSWSPAPPACDPALAAARFGSLLR